MGTRVDFYSVGESKLFCRSVCLTILNWKVLRQVFCNDSISELGHSKTISHFMVSFVVNSYIF